MGRPGFIQSLGFLYLLHFGHFLVDCRRISSRTFIDTHDSLDHDSSKDGKIAEAQAINSKAEAYQGFNYTLAHPWCNASSHDGQQHYHFDVQVNPGCTDGRCMAIELVRDPDSANPIMHVWQGKEWLVKTDADDQIEWNLFDPVAQTTGPKSEEGKDQIIQLQDVELVQLYDDLDRVEIIVKSETKDMFELNGGLYYDETLLKSKMSTTMGRQDFKYLQRKAVATNAAPAETRTAAGVLSVSAGTGFVAAVLFPPVLAWGAAALAYSGVMMGAAPVAQELGRKAKERVEAQMNKELIASRVLFEKLQCLSDFKECRENVLVPAGKPCP